MADSASLVKKERDKREKEKERQRKEKEAAQRESEARRFSYRPPPTPHKDESSEGSRFSYSQQNVQKQQRERQRQQQEQRRQDRMRSSVVTGAGGGQEEDRGSEGDRYSYRPPQHDREADRRDERRDRERDARRLNLVSGSGGGVPLRRNLLNQWGQQDQERERPGYQPPRLQGIQPLGLSTGLPSAREGMGGIGYNGPQSNTLASGVRPVGPTFGPPRPREEEEDRPTPLTAWRTPMAVEPGAMIRQPLNLLGGIQQAMGRLPQPH